MPWEEEMRQIDDPVRLRRRAANLEFGRGPGTRLDPGVLAQQIGESPVCTGLAAGGKWIRILGPAKVTCLKRDLYITGSSSTSAPALPGARRGQQELLCADDGARVVSLPDDPDTLRGYSAPKLIIKDEAAYVSDAMQAALDSGKHDDLVLALAIAVWRAHRGGNAGWVFLEAMRLRGMGSMASEPRYYIGVDLGQSRDPTAIAVVRRVDPPRPVPEHDKPKASYAPGSVEWGEEQRRLKTKLRSDDQSSCDSACGAKRNVIVHSTPAKPAGTQ